MTRPLWKRALPLLALLGLALLLRYPLGLYLEALPMDPNQGLHALVARDLAHGGTLGWLPSLGWPDGIHVRLLALPVLALATPLNLILAPAAAWSIGLTAWMTLQAWGAWWLLGRDRAAFVVAAALLLNPATVLFLGNGQVENAGLFSIVLAIWAGSRGRPLAGVTALLLAGFSSPYIAVAAGVSLVLTGATTRHLRAALLASLVAGGLVGAYYLPVVGGGLNPSVSPASGAHAEPATLWTTLAPVEVRTGTVGDLHAPPPPPGFDSRALLRPQALGDEAQELHPTRGSYLGLVLLLLGSWGLWRGRSDPLLRAATWAGATCLVLALGSWLHPTPDLRWPIPLPWLALAHLPALGSMGATGRFLVGTTAALALGLGHLAKNLRATAILVVLLAVDALALAPAVWPAPAGFFRFTRGTTQLGPEPIAIWPGPPTMDPRYAVRVSLVADRPVAWFQGAAPDELVRAGMRPEDVEIPATDLHGRTPEEWLQLLRDRDVHTLITLRPDPLPFALTKRFCEGTMCDWDLSTR